MTTDDFTTAAHAEAERRTRPPGISGQTLPSMEQFAERDGYRKGFIQAAEWARDHLAAQEETEEEVEAAAEAAFLSTGPSVANGMTDDWANADEYQRDRWRTRARAVLAAARAVRQEKR